MFFGEHIIEDSKGHTFSEKQYTTVENCRKQEGDVGSFR